MQTEQIKPDWLALLENRLNLKKDLKIKEQFLPSSVTGQPMWLLNIVRSIPSW